MRARGASWERLGSCPAWQLAADFLGPRTMTTVIDLGAHPLPGIGDGPSSLAESLELVRPLTKSVLR